jgi:zinc/manganese transport system substrate-binding protein
MHVGPAHSCFTAKEHSMMNRHTLFALLAAPLVLLALPAHAALRVFACEPEWGALAQELGGSLVEVSVATSALQDPHHIQAKPSLIARARNADLVVCTGAELEIGWLPVLLQQSGNAKVQPGQPGNFAAADHVRKLDVPSQLDRSQGDVHAAGNPHIQTDPRNIAQVAAALGARLQQVDPAHANEYAKAQADFAQRWQQAIARWTAQAAPLKGAQVVSQHKAFVYLYDWLGLKEVAVLEPKPGVEPTASHLQEVLSALKGTQARMVLYAAYQDPRPSEWLSKNAGIAAVKIPFTVGGTEGAKDLVGLFDDTLARLLAAGAKP